MPYNSIDELPRSVGTLFPGTLRRSTLAAFNSAWEQYDRPEERREGADREETAHRVAWAAVKQQYGKTSSPENG